MAFGNDKERPFGEPRSPREREIALAALAARQHRVVGDDQVIGLGFSRRAIRYRIDCGRMQRVHPGVLVVGPGALFQRGRWWAALLAGRPDPALSHLSSVAEQGLAEEVGPVHITVPRRTTQRLAGVTIHSARHLDRRDLTRSEDDLPRTALHRTLLDLAETLPFDRFEAIVEEADRRQWLDFGAIAGCMKRNPGRRGLKPLRALLADYLPVGDVNEGIERHFQVFLAEEGFPSAQHNVLVDGLLVDCYWPAHEFVVELDSRGRHRHWKQAERDRARDGTLLRGGRRWLRVTNHRLTRERGALIVDLAAVLPRQRRPSDRTESRRPS